MPGVIEATDLTKVFGSMTAVDNLSFEVREGEIFGFLGPNGAGKTTTVRMLTGILPMDHGTVTILGHDIRRDPVLAKQTIGVVPETSNAYVDLTGWQNLMLIGDLYGLDRVRAAARSGELLRMLGLYDRKDQKVQVYSKGMKQRLILAMALLHEPSLLFLDEPTSGLDVQSSQLILGMLQDLNRDGTTIFLTTHNMEEANRLCHRVGIIRRGTLVAIDAPEKLKQAIGKIHLIEVSFDGIMEETTLAGLNGVTRVTRNGDKWRITAKDQDVAIQSLVVASKQGGLRIVTLNTLTPSLDEVFLHLTQEGGL
ncbi:MAG: ATP-binding cassette domain-containing protein [Methanomicrobiaceae archaeon]|nr:ATP-binding cassette domain-containing protein [Methanomicrobiaceae archaeon]